MNRRGCSRWERGLWEDGGTSHDIIIHMIVNMSGVLSTQNAFINGIKIKIKIKQSVYVASFRARLCMLSLFLW